jgi:M6 family metalloprotease-like protein
MVDFQDVHHTKSVQDIQNVISQLTAYYTEVSYGKISIISQVYGWYTVSHTMGFYGADSKNPGDDDNKLQLAQDALDSLPSSVDVSLFKYLIIVHAGQDQADDQYNVRSDEIWSECDCSVFPDYNAKTPVYGRGAKPFSTYFFASEFNGYGTFAHEFGHALGLPDLYLAPASQSKSNVGYWSLMDTGNRCCSRGAESTPSYIGAWGAAVLGWLTPTVADANVAVSAFDLKPLESPTATAVLIPVSQSTYYFVESRSQTGSDSHLPNSGVLIYFVNENLRSGQGTLRLVNPTTGQLYPAQDHASDLNNAVFNVPESFKDPSNHVYLTFLGSGSQVTSLFSTQEVTDLISQTAIKTSQTSFTQTYGNELSLTAFLVDQKGIPLADQNVEVDSLESIGGWQQVGTTMTDQSGGILYSLKLPYPAGFHTFRFLFQGTKGSSTWFTAASTEFVVNIQPARMIIRLSQPPLTIVQSAVTISVTNDRGTPVDAALVLIFLDGVQQGTSYTDQNGIANFPLPFALTDVGLRTTTVTVSANNYQSSQSSTTTLLLSPFILLLIAAVIAVSIFVWKKKPRDKA